MSPSAERLTENAEAYSRYLEAIALSNFDDADDIPRGIELLDDAVALDPSFAKAYELKALFHWMNAGYTVDIVVGQQQVFESASRALQLDPSLTGAKSLQRTSDVSNWSWIIELDAMEDLVASERTVRRLDTYAYDLSTTGYFSEAEAIYREILIIDPLSTNAIWRLGMSIAMQGRLEEARAQWNKAANLGAGVAHGLLAVADLLSHDDQSAAKHLALSNLKDVWSDYSDEVAFISAMRDPISGKASLDTLVSNKEASAKITFDARFAYDFYLAFGYVDEYSALVDKLNPPGPVWADGEDMETFGLTFPQSGFAAHPSYIRRATALGMTDLWEQRGAPEHCSKKSGDWICE